MCYAKVCNEFEGPYISATAPAERRSFQKNVAAVASHWQYRVKFDQPENWTEDLSLQRQTLSGTTHWLEQT